MSQMHKSIRHSRIKNITAFALTAVVLHTSSCRKEEKPPISKEELASIMIDVHLAEAYTSLMHKDSTAKGPEKNLDSLAFYYKDILNKHHLTTQAFDSAFQWYRFHPALLDSVYSKVVAHFDSLQAMK